MKHLDTYPPEVAAIIRARRNRTRQTVASIRQAIAADDANAFGAALAVGSEYGFLPTLFAAIAKTAPAGPRVQAHFLGCWFHSGNSFRNDVGADIVLIKVLRVLMPPYAGPPRTLYRGQNRLSKKTRRPGLAWTTDRQIAEGHARGIWQTYDGGSVILEAQAAAHAIICELSAHGYEDEAEYLVDRNRLSEVRVIAKFVQRPL